MARELCILDDQLRHLESTAYGISSSSSVHPHPLQAPDNFPPSLPIDPSTFWHHPHHHHHLHAQPPLAPDDNRMSITLPYPSPLPLYHSPEVNTPPGGREKRHRCQLCNKRFDRPSTLKKHMLVHTGEKAWACDICGRRFSVSSNLNRHLRRCKEKWAKSDSSATDNTPPPSAPSESTGSSPPSSSCSSSSSSSSSSNDGSDAYRPPSPQLTDQQKRRQSTPGPVQYETDYPTPGSHDQQQQQQQQHVPGGKRRRKCSPIEPWVPPSLVNFNLDSSLQFIMPTPLPAVVPGTREERDSFANTPSQAYHPACWTGNLVGPSYAPKSEDMSGSHYCGKLLVF